MRLQNLYCLSIWKKHLQLQNGLAFFGSVCGEMETRLLLRNAAPRIEFVGPEAKVVTGYERQVSALKI